MAMMAITTNNSMRVNPRKPLSEPAKGRRS